MLWGESNDINFFFTAAGGEDPCKRDRVLRVGPVDRSHETHIIEQYVPYSVVLQ